MQHSDFVHLHVHSEYSLLDGAAQLEKLVAKAKELKFPAIALTDHGNLFGAIDFYQAAQKGGIKPIVGCELYVAPRGRKERGGEDGGYEGANHLTVLVRNLTGYKNLIKLVAKAYLEGFYYKPRVDEALALLDRGVLRQVGGRDGAGVRRDPGRVPQHPGGRRALQSDARVRELPPAEIRRAREPHAGELSRARGPRWPQAPLRGKSGRCHRGALRSRASHHREDGVRRLLPGRVGLHSLRARARDRRGPWPRLLGRLSGGVLPGHHERRPDPVWPAVRALPQPGADLDARH